MSNILIDIERVAHLSLDSSDCTRTVGLVNEGQDVTPVKTNIHNRLSGHISLEHRSLDVDFSHTGCDVIAISDISGTVDIGIPLLPANSPCRASSLEDRTLRSQSDRRPVFDIEESKVFSAQVDPVKSIELTTGDMVAPSLLVLSSYSPLHPKFSWFSRDIAGTESRIHICTCGVLYSLFTVTVIASLCFLGWHCAMTVTFC